MRRATVKPAPHDEWEKMIRKLEAMTNKDIQTTWDALRNYDPTEYYAPGINMDSWAQAVYSEMDHRGIPHLTPISKG